MAIFAKPKRLPALRRQAEQTLKSLKRSRSSKGSVYLTVSSDSSPISIPSDAVFYLEQILEHMAKGQQVEIVSGSQMMTTQQAADFMNVSRPYVVKLMETGELPFTKVGTHRRIAFKDLDTYQTAQKKRARKALQKLADQAQELDMGY
ncbi:MAG: toxin-antitoxin system antidote component [Bacteroidetes bacterium HLUCCA01]|nr:MAG: toxin-antitoxin system antidote component [Bacteroidetes bacterium HLUCCA01]